MGANEQLCPSETVVLQGHWNSFWESSWDWEVLLEDRVVCRLLGMLKWAMGNSPPPLFFFFFFNHWFLKAVLEIRYIDLHCWREEPLWVHYEEKSFNFKTRCWGAVEIFLSKYPRVKYFLPGNVLLLNFRCHIVNVKQNCNVKWCKRSSLSWLLDSCSLYSSLSTVEHVGPVNPTEQQHTWIVGCF